MALQPIHLNAQTQGIINELCLPGEFERLGLSENRKGLGSFREAVISELSDFRERCLFNEGFSDAIVSMAKQGVLHRGQGLGAAPGLFWEVRETCRAIVRLKEEVDERHSALKLQLKIYPVHRYDLLRPELRDFAPKAGEFKGLSSKFTTIEQLERARDTIQDREDRLCTLTHILIAKLPPEQSLRLPEELDLEAGQGMTELAAQYGIEAVLIHRFAQLINPREALSCVNQALIGQRIGLETPLVQEDLTDLPSLQAKLQIPPQMEIDGELVLYGREGERFRDALCLALEGRAQERAPSR